MGQEEENGRDNRMAELKDQIELENTREKLRMLEQQFAAAQAPGLTPLLAAFVRL